MPPLTPYEELLLKTIAEINRDTGKPARTAAIMTRYEAMARSTVNWYLKRMETKGAVRRLSPKTGWLAATPS